MKGRLALELIEVAWIMFTLYTKLCNAGLGRIKKHMLSFYVYRKHMILCGALVCGSNCGTWV